MTYLATATSSREATRALPVIALQGVGKRFGKVQAVRDLTLEITPGEIFGLLGPNGAGKTTTIQMLLGLTAPSEGSVRVFSVDPVREPLTVRTRTGIVLQQSALDSYLTGWENIQLHAELYPFSTTARQERIELVLNWAGLTDAATRLVHTYSGGMKRRLDLAISMLHRPRLLMLDEPTLGLDVLTRRQLWSLINELKDAGTTVLLTTHYLEEANRLCDRIGIMQGGRLIALDTPTALKQTVVDDLHRLSVTLRAVPPKLTFPLEPRRQGNKLIFSGAPKALWRALAALQNENEDDILEVSYEQPSLDDVFVRLTEMAASNA